MTTAAELAQIGLTFSEIEAAERGERTGVVVEGVFYPIYFAWAAGVVCNIRFGSLSVSDSGVDSWQIWAIEISGDGAVVSYFEA